VLTVRQKGPYKREQKCVWGDGLPKGKPYVPGGNSVVGRTPALQTERSPGVKEGKRGGDRKCSPC